jgi:uncharacterized repeat protein (TIGR02543 family)
MKHYIKTAVVRVAALFALVIMLASQASAQIEAGAVVKFVRADGPAGGDGSSWANAYTNLHQAAAANLNSTLTEYWIKKGTYYSSATNATQMTVRNLKRFYGGFNGDETTAQGANRNWINNQTIISGALASAPTTPAQGTQWMYMINGFASTNVFDGLIFENFKCSSGNVIIYAYYTSMSGSNLVFRNNQTGLGVIRLDLQSVAYRGNLANCLFYNNTTVGALANNVKSIFLRRMPATAVFTIENCTFYEPSSTGTNVIQNDNGTAGAKLIVTNSIVWQTQNDNGIKATGGTEVYNSIVKNGFGGTGSGISSANPLFADVANNDFRVGFSSPAVDGANSSSALTKDILNVTRPQKRESWQGGSGTNDMGAYENGPYFTNLVVTVPAGLSNTVFGLASANTVNTNMVFGSVTMSAPIQTNVAQTLRYVPTNWVSGANFTGAASKTFTATGHTNFTCEFRTEYFVTNISSDVGLGTVGISPGAGFYATGAEVIFTATTTKTFDGWFDQDNNPLPGDNTASPYTFTVGTAAKVVTGRFSSGAATKQVTIYSDPLNQPFTVNGNAGVHGVAYNWDVTTPVPTTYTLAATTPNALIPGAKQAVFVQWYEGNPDNQLSPTASFGYDPVNQDAATFYAEYKIQWNLTLAKNPSAGGNITGDTAGWYDDATPVSVTAEPNAGYLFVNWTGDIGSETATDATIDLTMDQARSVQANFKKVFFVKETGTGSGTSWTDAASLTTALSGDASGDQIWVEQGTYKPSSVTTYFTLDAGVELYGGFAGTESSLAARVNPTLTPSILSGDISGNNQADYQASPRLDCQKLLLISGANTVVDGFTFKHVADVNAYGTSASATGGGAIRITSSTGPVTIRKCSFTENWGSYGAGGIVAYNSSYTWSGNIVIENCRFYNNAWDSVNSKGNICGYLRSGHTVYMRNCVVAENQCSNASDGGAFMVYGQTTYLQNNIFDQPEQVPSYDNTVNYETVWGGGFKAVKGTVKLYNDCVVNGFQAAYNAWGYKSADGLNNLVELSAVQTPSFFNAAAGDFRLATGSLCINKGSNTLAAATDIRGDARPVLADGSTGISDIGAYEMGTFYATDLATAPETTLNVLVDGVEYAAPETVQCEGSSVTLSAIAQTNVALNTRWIPTNWVDGVGSATAGASRSFTPSGAASYTCNFQVDYKVTIASNILNAGNVTMLDADGWVESNKTVSFNADKAAGYNFVGWYDQAGNALQGDNTTTDYVCTVSGWLNVTGRFASASSKKEITFKASPVDVIDIKLDTVTQPNIGASGLMVEWDNPSAHSFDADSPQSLATGKRAVFDQWYNETASAQYSAVQYNDYSVLNTDALTLRADFHTEWQLTVATNPAAGAGTVTGSTEWYNAGDSANLTATATGSGYVFNNWTGDTGAADPTSPSITVTMDQARTLTANFKSVVFVNDATGTDAAGRGTSWALAYKTLNYALTASAAGSEFWVAAGSYSPASATTGMQLENGDVVYGGFAGSESLLGSRNWTQNVTIVTGDWTGDSASDMTTAPLMLVASAEGQSAKVDGLIFQRGKNSNTGKTVVGSAIGGNAAARIGGTVIEHCIFRDNESADCVVLNEYSTTAIRNSLFVRNTAVVGTVYNRRGLTELTGCTLADNNGYDVVSGNDGTDSNPSVYMTNCIARSGLSAVAILDAGAAARIINCNVKDLANVSYSTKTGSVDEDPLLTSDYRLSYGSPSVDDGAAVDTTLDLAGRTRTLNGAPDLGCYEGTTFTVAVNPTTGASVTFNGVLYSAPALVGVEAGTYTASRTTPQAEGTTTQYVFSAWSLDGDTSTGPTRSVVVTTANRVLDVTFTKQFKLGLTITPVGYGTVANGTDGAWYDSGSVLSLNPAAVEGVVFSAWSGDLTGSSDPQNLTMSAAKNVTATFIADGPTAILFQ